MAELANLPDGTYKIVNLGSGLVVGRRLAEDKSFRPKGIFTLNPDVPIEGGRVVSYLLLPVIPVLCLSLCAQWTLENIGEGKYKLQAGKAPVGDADNLLWAFLTEPEQASAGEWRIIPVPQMARDAYMYVGLGSLHRPILT